MPRDVKQFILNDETVQNSYGFFVVTDGIKTDRFTQNPVMLSDHRNSNSHVLGKWNDLIKKDHQLLATPEFDEEDEDADKIAGKVERGFIKGASMGLLFNYDDMIYVEGKIVLKSCELIEASIIPVPSNPNSLRLYLKEGVPLTEDEIKSLCLNVQQPIDPENFNTNIDMKKIILSIPALMALGITEAANDGVDEAIVNAKIVDLAAKNKTLTEENEKYKGASEAANLKAKTELVADAVKDGKITADKSAAFLALEFEQAKGILDAIPAKKSLGAITEPGNEDATAIKTVDDFEKLSVEKQLAFKNDHPEAYTKLFT